MVVMGRAHVIENQRRPIVRSCDALTDDGKHLRLSHDFADLPGLLTRLSRDDGTFFIDSHNAPAGPKVMTGTLLESDGYFNVFEIHATTRRTGHFIVFSESRDQCLRIVTAKCQNAAGKQHCNDRSRACRNKPNPGMVYQRAGQHGTQ